MSVEELSLPAEADGFEVARVVIDDQERLVFVTDSLLGQNEDPTCAWGMLLADLTNHIANCLQDQLKKIDGSRVTREEIVKAIRLSFNDELDDPTDVVERMTDS